MRDYNYSLFAKYYDQVEQSDPNKKLNPILLRKFRRFKVKKVLDLTCGTGEQSIFLHQKGFHVTASDITPDMVKVAKKKYPKIRFHVDDMRTAQFGKFDAVITIFNAIGHLSKDDFSKTLLNVRSNLREGGYYVFDIFNLDYMRRNFRSHEWIDTAMEFDGNVFVRFNHNSLDVRDGVMNINQKSYLQEGRHPLRVLREKWDMQIYSASQLKSLLSKAGFRVVSIEDRSGKKFSPSSSVSVLVVAQKVGV